MMAIISENCEGKKKILIIILTFDVIVVIFKII